MMVSSIASFILIDISFKLNDTIFSYFLYYLIYINLLFFIGVIEFHISINFNPILYYYLLDKFQVLFKFFNGLT